MNGGINPKLLEDLARLAKKYSEEDFTALVALLSREETRSQLIEGLLLLATASKRKPKPEKTQDKKTRRPILERIANVNEARLPELKQIHEGLQARVFLPNKPDLKEVFVFLGLSYSEKQSRSRIAETIVLKLATMPQDQFNKFKERFLQPHKGSDEQFADWTKHILQKKP